jgi:hypothetical protein
VTASSIQLTVAELVDKSEKYQCSNDISLSNVVFDGTQTSPACPSDKKSRKIKMSVEHWWNGTDRGKLKYWERNII